MAYEPENPGLIDSFEGMCEYIYRELRRVSDATLSVENVRLAELHVAPDKPREGMIVLADGTDWDPGSGAGFYGYRGSSWTLLG